MNRKGVAERFAALGFGCDVWTDPPGQVWADFVHDVDEIVLLVKGEIEVCLKGKTLRPGPGEEIVIPAGASHTAGTTGKTVNRWYYGCRLGSRRRDHRPRDEVCAPLLKNAVLAEQGFRIARLHPHEPQGCVLPVPQAGQGIAPLEDGVTASATAPAFPARSPQDQGIEYLLDKLPR